MPRSNKIIIIIIIKKTSKRFQQCLEEVQNRDGLSLGCSIQTMLTNCAKLKPSNPFDISVRFSISWKVVQRIQLINNPQKQMINIHQYRRFAMCRPIALNIFECFDIFVWICLHCRPNCLISRVFQCPASPFRAPQRAAVHPRASPWSPQVAYPCRLSEVTLRILKAMA